MVRLISMAMTGYYRTMQRPRVHQPLSMLKYDPIGTFYRLGDVLASEEMASGGSGGGRAGAGNWQSAESRGGMPRGHTERE
jgi:hypothetical protein